MIITRIQMHRLSISIINEIVGGLCLIIATV